MSVLKADSVTKAYSGRRVVNGITLEVKGGEVVGLLGPNGAGKTTTFHMMVGLVKPVTTARELHRGVFMISLAVIEAVEKRTT